MDDIREKTTGLADHIEDLANTFYRLTLLNVVQKTTNIVSGAIVMIALFILGFFTLLFLGIALAWWLVDLVNSRALGFVLGAVFFIIILAFIIMLRKKLVFPLIRNSIIKKVYDQGD